MAKTIKFNLICDDIPIRTVEDLQEHFSIEDVLMYYRNGLLQRWLKVRGYEKELEKVLDIKSEDSLEIIKNLIEIFDVSADKKAIEEGVYIFEFLVEQKELCSHYEQNKFKVDAIINDYQAGYTQLVNGILNNPNDVARIKANIEEMASNYKWALDLNHRDLFWALRDKSDLAIMCLLMNEKTRKYFLFEENEEDDDSTDITDKTAMFNSICDLAASSDLDARLGDNLLKYAGQTEGYWKDLEPKGKKYMIIRMGIGDFVRSAGLSGGDLANKDIKNSFVIVDGVDYKSNSETRKLLYMEV